MRKKMQKSHKEPEQDRVSALICKRLKTGSGAGCFERSELNIF